MSCIVLDIELTEKNIIKELGLFIDGSVQGFSFCPPKTFKPNKQTTSNTRQLHGTAWSSGKLEYEKPFAVFYDINVMNAELFVERLEKCGLLTSLLRQIVENLDDYGCSKFKSLLEKQKRTVHGSALVTLFDAKKASLCREESKGVWRNGYATFNCITFVRVYCIYVYY